MNKKNRNFEDILLTGAFEEYLRREAEKLPSDEELREEFPPREEECRKYGEKARRKGRASSAMVILKRVAVITLAVISVTFALLMMDKNVRAAVTGTIIRIFDDHTDVSFNDPDSEINFFEGKEVSDLSVGYVPEGLVMCEEAAIDDDEYADKVRLLIMSDPNDPDPTHRASPPFITILIRSDDAVWKFSNEAMEITKETSINGMNAFLECFFINHDGESVERGVLIFGDKTISVEINWAGLSKDEAIKVAESIK